MHLDYKGIGLAGEYLPLHQHGGASFSVGLSVDEVAFQAEEVVEAGVDRGEVL